MLNLTAASPVYLACGETDMRKSIDGLAAIVQEQFELNPFSSALFVFCNRLRIFWFSRKPRLSKNIIRSTPLDE
ncbi:IS66 family insertion sequence element accessory protein TnpB [Paenibacillus thiaminolyticus]|uniref:IS66 family insertion sequence element accessory protein TnpB n=1 Tax=Paenibacillus thiaminolyticus TaxID=49283 RepID=UPI003B987B5E